MSVLAVRIEGIGFWAPGYPDWTRGRAGLRGEASADPAAPTRPCPGLLAAAERRRAPAPVLLACEVAAQACAAAGRDPAQLGTVFASVHGDLVITDYMCETLAAAPRELSPIRFHNSVHNAPAGYWTIAAQCHLGSTSISGWHASFGAALYEAAVEALAENAPILLAAYDTESKGPLVEVSPASSQFGVALVITPGDSGTTSLRLSRVRAGDAQGADLDLPADFAAMAASNPMAAGALPLMLALACGDTARVRLATGADSVLNVEIGA
jgi:hypothetical protein